MKFVIRDERLFHLLRHFENIDNECLGTLIQIGYTNEQIIMGLKASGSLFLPSFCSSPSQLPKVLSILKPAIIKLQKNGFYIINFLFKKHIGTNGLVRIDELSKRDQERIFFQKRDGIKIKVIKGIKAPGTGEVHVIAKQKLDSNTYSIITCFPGTLSPPFPKYITNEEERLISENFWKKHVLMEQ